MVPSVVSTVVPVVLAWMVTGVVAGYLRVVAYPCHRLLDQVLDLATVAVVMGAKLTIF